MTPQTLLEAAQSLAAHVRDAYPKPFFAMKYEVHAELIHALEQALVREKAKPQDVAEVINDLDAKMHASFAMSPKQTSGTSKNDCGNCKNFSTNSLMGGPKCATCESLNNCSGYSNWEPKP